MKKSCVVFVHGFTGGTGTWKNSNGEVFSDLLRADNEIDQAYDFLSLIITRKLPASLILLRWLGCLGCLVSAQGKSRRTSPSGELVNY